MLTAILEVLLALLAAVGLMAVGWLVFGRFVLPLGNEDNRTMVVVEARGDGAGLEQTVHGLLWLRRGDLWRYRVVIMDCGLDSGGRDIARRLAAGGGHVSLCPLGDMTEYLNKEFT